MWESQINTSREQEQENIHHCSDRVFDRRIACGIRYFQQNHLPRFKGKLGRKITEK